MRWSFTLFLNILFVFGQSQSLLESDPAIKEQFVFQITNEEALELLTEENSVDTSYFHTLLLKFNSDSIQISDLEFDVGHYIHAYINQGLVTSELFSINNVYVEVLNNQADLNIRVMDNQGQAIKNAHVSVGKKNIPFNNNTETYAVKRSYMKGILSVEYNGIVSYYDLKREVGRRGFRTKTNQILYAKPIRYIWRPIRIVGGIPIDGVRSIVKNRPVGSIYEIKEPVADIVRSFEYDHPTGWINDVTCFFAKNAWYCDNETYVEDFIVFNKPKYRPGDTVKYKAYVVKQKNGKPYKKTLSAEIYPTRPTKKLGFSSSYAKGAYTGQFILHDSLNLKLDERYSLMLVDKSGNPIVSGRFKYEDYDLKSAKYTITTSGQKHFKGDSLVVTLKGEDENELPLFDVNVKLTVKPKIQGAVFFREKAFLADTLFASNFKLEKDGNTKVVIDTSQFPESNFTYEIESVFLDSGNERVVVKKEVDYYHHAAELNLELEKDSLFGYFLENGIRKEKQAFLSGLDKFGLAVSRQKVELPTKIPFNPLVSEYVLTHNEQNEVLNVGAENSLVQVLAERDKDSVKFFVQNPRQLGFNYHIYYLNKEIKSGTGNAVEFTEPNRGNKHYYFSIQYVWAGQTKSENYKVDLNERLLAVNVKEPKVTYPGAKVPIEIEVRDINKEPVANVDLTAFSYTAKFKQEPNSIPQFTDNKKARRYINEFSINGLENIPAKQFINVPFWEKTANLSQNRFYQFLFPEKDIFQEEITISDSLSQFAPFVLKNGQKQPIHIIEVDGVPVYFSFVNNSSKPYSFRVIPGKRALRLRLTDKWIKLDSVHFNPGKKKILSIDQELIESPTVHVGSAPNTLTKSEQRVYWKYLFPYRRTNLVNAYVNQADQFLMIPRNGKRLVGPVYPVLFTIKGDDLDERITHEPYFEYEFSTDLVKMRNIENPLRNLQLSSYSDGNAFAFTDIAFTQNHVDSILNARKVENRRFGPTLDYGSQNFSGECKLRFHYEAPNKLLLSTIIIPIENENKLRVIPGGQSTIFNLKTGEYKMIFLEDEGYFMTDVFSIKKGGLNYYRFKRPNELRTDSLGLSALSLIDRAIGNDEANISEREALIELADIYRDQAAFATVDRVSGYVYADGEGLIGATVKVPGTTLAAITGLHGEFSIDLPFGVKELQASYIGYTNQIRLIGNQSEINFELEADALGLDEVVVTALSIGTETKNLGYSSVSALQGRAPGVTISNVSGAAGFGTDTRLRGDTSINGDLSPLIIIDGVVYSGSLEDIDMSKLSNLEVLKGENATSLYGSRASNGVVVVTSKSGISSLKLPGKFSETPKAELPYIPAGLDKSSLRNNFSDYAFWQPQLTTDRAGKASFTSILPDDVTKWNTYYYAINGNRQSGNYSGSIRSFKPIMGQLEAPRFFVQGDNIDVVGKALNYLGDSTQVSTTFLIDGIENQKDSFLLTDAEIAKYRVTVPQQDTLQITYRLDKEGYFDGEQYDIPVVKQGSKQVEGQFLPIYGDTTFTIVPKPNLSPLKIVADADLMTVWDNEVNYLRSYKFLCNEQLASKLKAVLLDKKVKENLGEKWKHERDVPRLINLLEKRMKKDGVWGWWGTSEPVPWISQHVLEAFHLAKQAGYSVDVNVDQLIPHYIYNIQKTPSFSQINDLRILKLYDAEIDYERFLKRIDSLDLTYSQRLEIADFQSSLGLEYNSELISDFQHETILNNIYWHNDTSEFNWKIRANKTRNTMLALKILRRSKDSSQQNLMNKAMGYLLEQRNLGRWRNTYESSLILEEIANEFIELKNFSKPAEIIIGNQSFSAEQFPIELELSSNQPIEVSKTGIAPIYFSYSQEGWNPNPDKREDLFEVESYFGGNGNSEQTLEAGKPISFTVHVKALKDAEFVMIQIPIPSGCGYEEKSKSFRETYRESFKEQTNIYVQKMEKGNYTFELKLIPKFTGTFTLNPARVELMYFDTLYGNNEVKDVEIH